jgi:hypothetical protein
MSWLKNRNGEIPNGLTFNIPEVNWTSRRNSSFQGIVEAAVRLVEANPSLQGKYPTLYSAMADMVDEYNAGICEQNGWTQYIVSAPGGEPVQRPFPEHNHHSPSTSPRPNLPPTLNRLADVAGGAETLVHWIASNADACPQELANERAYVCSECPMNGKGGLERYFTITVAKAVRKAYELRHGMKLSTPLDDKLGVCEACTCPLKLKVHFKIEDLKVEPSLLPKLHPLCWITKELNAKAAQS